MKVTAVAATGAPTEAEPTEGRLRLIGWMALGAVIATIVAAFVPFLTEGGIDYRAIDAGWYQVWVLMVGGLAVCAAFLLLGQGLPRGPGVALILGIAPTAVAGGFSLSAPVAKSYKYHDGVLGPGYILAMAGSVALVVAAVLAATRAREVLKLTPPPAPRAATVTAVAAIIGVGAAVALGALAVVGYPQGDNLDLRYSLLWKLALWLLLLTIVACVLNRWLSDHHVRGRLRVVGTALLYGVVVFVFLGAADPYSGLDALILGWYAALVVGATVVPVVATLVLPRRLGAVLLVAWAAGMFAEGGTWIWDGAHTAGRVVLSVSLLAAIALAAALWTGSVDRLTGERSPGPA